MAVPSTASAASDTYPALCRLLSQVTIRSIVVTIQPELMLELVRETLWPMLLDVCTCLQHESITTTTYNLTYCTFVEQLHYKLPNRKSQLEVNREQVTDLQQHTAGRRKGLFKNKRYRM